MFVNIVWRKTNS